MTISTVAAIRVPQQAQLAATNDPVDTGMMVGGGIATAAGLGTAGYAIHARRDLPSRRADVTRATQELAGARQGVADADAALAADRVHPPAGTSAEDAAAWARTRFDDGSALTAFTREGTARDVSIGRWGTPSRSQGEALDRAMSMSDGRGGAVVRAGEWHVPARLTDDLDAIEKTRQVAYTETVWEYHYGPNPANGNKYEYHYGPHQVTKYRTERYLDPFREFRSAHDGMESAFTDELDQLRSRGTRPELALERARNTEARAVDQLARAERAVRFSENKAGMVRNIGLGVAAAGAVALGVGYLMSRD